MLSLLAEKVFLYFWSSRLEELTESERLKDWKLEAVVNWYSCVISYEARGKFMDERNKNRAYSLLEFSFLDCKYGWCNKKIYGADLISVSVVIIPTVVLVWLTVCGSG